MDATGLGGTPFPEVVFCLGGGCGFCVVGGGTLEVLGAEAVTGGGAGADAGADADAAAGANGVGAVGSTLMGDGTGLVGEGGRVARWGGGALAALTAEGEEVEMRGERCGACAGGGMDAEAPLELEPSGWPAVDGLEAGGPEAIDVAVDGREPELDGNARVVLANMGGGAPAAPGKASPNGSRCNGRPCDDDDDNDARALMLPGWVKYEDSRVSRGVPADVSDMVAEDRLRMGVNCDNCSTSAPSSEPCSRCVKPVGARGVVGVNSGVSIGPVSLRSIDRSVALRT